MLTRQMLAPLPLEGPTDRPITPTHALGGFRQPQQALRTHC